MSIGFNPEQYGNALGQECAELLEQRLAPYIESRDGVQAALTASVVLSAAVLSWATDGLTQTAQIGLLRDFWANVEQTLAQMVRIRQTAAQEDAEQETEVEQ